MANIKIGPSFFAKSKADYNSWRWAWVRELGQNSFDVSDTTKVEFNFKFDGVHTIASCENNGEPMTLDVLVNKFLALGESGKSFQNGAVGGFGKAKELIALTHEEYQIRTGTVLVIGSGADYELTENLEYFHGTKTTVKMKGNEVEALGGEVRRFCSYAQVDCGVTLIENGKTETFDCDLRKGSPRRELAFGTVYTNKSFSNKLVVRMGGIPMFSNYVGLDRCVILELNGASSGVLTSNRDGLSGAYQSQLFDFITELSVDKRSALKPKQPKYKHYKGARYGHHVQNKLNVAELVGSAKERAGAAIAAFIGKEGGGSGRGFYSPEGPLAEVVKSNISEEFVIKNETELAVPEYYLPDSKKFCGYAKKLARIWGRLLLELHRVFDVEGDFGIGFIFDGETVGEHEDGQFGRIFYINPCCVVEQAASRSKSFKKRWALTDRNQLLSLALHEFCHIEHRSHDEDYSSALTDMMGKVLDERKRFNWAFTE